jgi:hypothetical protein
MPEAAWSDSTASAAAALTRVLISMGADSGQRQLLAYAPRVPLAATRARWSSLIGADVVVQWNDHTMAAGLAVSAERMPDPSAAVLVRAAGGARPRGGATALVLRDAGGVLDSVPGVLSTGWRVASTSAPLRVRAAQTDAQAVIRDAPSTRRVMVLALPGWESKFVAASLEESGWMVDGRFRVSPRTAITVGAPQRLDTAVYAVVVVLDSMDVDAGALGRFVRAGGGLVLGGDALRIPSLAALRPARTTTSRAGVAGGLVANAPEQGLDAWELVVDGDAEVLRAIRSDHAHDEPVLIAKRVGLGRVVASGYRNSWRWRMEGTDDGAAEHRQWWGAVVAAAVGTARLSPFPPADALPGAAAPYADFVARVGAPIARAVRAPAGDDARSTPDPRSDRWRPGPALLFVMIGAGLLGEWTSRRLRGRR